MNFERDDYIPFNKYGDQEPTPPTREEIAADVQQKFQDGEYRDQLWDLFADHPYDAINVALWYVYGIEDNRCALRDFQAAVTHFLQERTREAIDYWY